MKYVKIILIILILFVLLNLIGRVEEGEITSRSVLDIRAVQVIGTDVSIMVDNGPPKVFLNSPLNITYNYNNIELNFTIFDDTSDISLMWYNLNNTNNITLTANTSFTSSEGSNTLYIFANDTLGLLNNSISITFFVNTSKGHNVTYNNFGGQTTNFNSINKSLQQNLSNVIIHSPSYGKIKFNDAINISRNLNLDYYVEISDNLITVDSVAYSELNKAATLELYDLTFTNPKIQKDGSDCSSDICSINSYLANTLSFNITHFTTYSATETTVSSGTPSGGSTGGSGGGGGSDTSAEALTIYENSIKIKLEQDEEYSYFLKIKNNREKELKVNLEIDHNLNFINIEDNKNKYSFNINPSERKNIEFLISAKNLKENIYVGKLKIETDDFEEVIPIVIEIVSKGPKLFDIEIDIPSEFRFVEAGENINANIILFNLGARGDIEAKVEYTILDLDGNVVISDEESLLVETQFQKIKEFKLPPYLKPGDYVFSVKVTYLDGNKERVNTATSLFEVGGELQFPEGLGLNSYILIILTLLIVIILFVIYQFRVLGVLKNIHKVHKKYKIKGESESISNRVKKRWILRRLMKKRR